MHYFYAHVFFLVPEGTALASIDDSRIDKLTAAILWSRDTLSTVVLKHS